MGSNIRKWDPGNSKQVQYHMYRHMTLHIMGINLHTHELPSKEALDFLSLALNVYNAMWGVDLHFLQVNSVGNAVSCRKDNNQF